jgi:hypothetical protein
MKRLAAIAVLVALALPASASAGSYPSLTRVTFDGDFDSGCSVLSGEGGWPTREFGVDYPGSVTIDRSQVAEGACSGLFSIPASTHGRAEIQAPSYSPDPTIAWEQELYIPSTSANGPRHGSIGQTKMNNNPCYNGGLVLSDRLPGDEFAFSVTPDCNGSTHYDLGPVPRDHWFAVKVWEVFGSAGALKVWIDPDAGGPAIYALKLSKPAPFDTTPVSNATVKLRQGIYYNNPDSHEAHVWGDGFHANRWTP